MPPSQLFRRRGQPITCLLLSAIVASRLSLVSGSSPTDTGTSPVSRCNIRDYGAIGDGFAIDTAAIQRAIEACAGANGGVVVFPPGRYLLGTVHLRSRVGLHLESGAALVGTTNLALYQSPEIPESMPEAKWGKWHRALVLGENVEDVAITGQGEIDGNKVFDPVGEEHMRGPHTILLVNCRRFTLRDFSIKDSGNYAVFFQVTDDVDIHNLKISGGWDGIHFRGSPARWCHRVSITGCRLYTGDDSIAGRYWDEVVISGCLINSSCNGLRLIGPATNLVVDHCLFTGPGREPHRSSNRTNMLSGIILQPGAWDKTEGLLDEVLISQNTMRNVASPVTVWTKPGNRVGRITVAGLQATGVYRSAFSVESWSDTPITNITFRDASVEFAGGGKTEQASQPVKGPGVDARALPAWGLYVRNVESVTLEDVRLSLANEDLRPVIVADHVARLRLDDVRFPRFPQVSAPIIATNGTRLEARETDLSR